jgi:hypothetical protein
MVRQVFALLLALCSPALADATRDVKPLLDGAYAQLGVTLL